MKPLKHLLIILCSVLNISFTQANTLTFGVVPQQSAKQLAKTWAPFLDELSQRAGIEIVFATAKDIPTFEQRLGMQEYDIAYMNPYHYVVFNDSAGYQALVKQKEKQITGIIVIHKDSPISSLQDLAGHQLAFPAPAAFAATIIPQSVLQSMGIKIESRYVSSHDSVYLNVARKFLSAGGGVTRTFSAAPQEVRLQLKVLWQSQAYTPHAIAVLETMPDETKQSLSQAFLSFNNDPNGTEILENIKFKGFDHAHDRDWNDIRALNIKAISLTGHQ